MRKIISFILIAVSLLTAIPVAADETAVVTENTAEPTVENITIFINEQAPSGWVNVICENSTAYVPAIAFAKLFHIDVNVIDYYNSAATVLSQGTNTAYFFVDNYYAIINTQGVDLPSPTKNINNILYVPLEVVTSLFEIEYTITPSEDGASIYFTDDFNPNAEKYENTINSLNLTSDTDYLIWVSKNDYSVRIFTKNNGLWKFSEEFPCSVGATYTPTCEGTFKYYEKIERWSYGSYYVAPVMRFNKGYALHSTLINYNGTPHDARLGMNISAGCVRLTPEDMQYIWDLIPLNTTIHVSAN